jgi:hypothetical protein
MTFAKESDDDNDQRIEVLVPPVPSGHAVQEAGVPVSSDVRMRQVWRSEERVDATPIPAPVVEAEPAPVEQPEELCCLRDEPEPQVERVYDVAPSGGEASGCISIARAVGISEAGLGTAEIICRYFPGDSYTALRVARCESGVDLYALASSGDSHGVYQLHQIHSAKWPDYWPNVWDAEWNIAHAAQMVWDSGWSAWACY